MKITLGRLAAVSLVALAGAGIAAPAAAQKIENQYACVFNPGLVAKGQVKAEANRSARAAGANVKFTYDRTIHGFAVNAAPQALSRMQASNPRIAYCEQDQVYSTSAPPPGKGPGGGGGDGGTGSGPAQTTPWGIARVGGGQTGATGRALVIDSGVDLDHPDLNVNAGLSVNFTRDKDADDGNGHGTHVAGTIAAIDNPIGVIGVAPSAEVIGIKVLDRRGSGSTSGVIAGIQYAASIAHSNDVANMSLGGGFSQALNDAVIAAAQGGLRFALAAGNESTSATSKSPASANHPNIYTISSFAQGDNWSSFSNYGNPPVDYAEPGSAIFSTYMGGGYATLSGTSMASPHAAGLLLLGGLRSGGTVKGDPDGNPDIIGIR